MEIIRTLVEDDSANNIKSTFSWLCHFKPACVGATTELP